MNPIFWERFHGGATHFPIALVIVAALFDTVAFFTPPARWAERALSRSGYWLVLLGAAGAIGAVFSGLALSRWSVAGAGSLLRHHLFVWPAFGLMTGLAVWRWAIGNEPSSRRAFAIYLGMMAITCLLFSAAGFFGGEMFIEQ